MVSTNETIAELTKRQIAINLDNRLSSTTVEFRNTRSVSVIFSQRTAGGHALKIIWKYNVKLAVNKYLTEKLITEVKNHSDENLHCALYE